MRWKEGEKDEKELNSVPAPTPQGIQSLCSTKCTSQNFFKKHTLPTG